ncbi:hypothetical protein COCNU_03G001320 [Cocos nucifera]|uniref:Uncharacterized protein n=1 Tax=Cocos nucifera TaxID=13894 RepID=A0A8K0I1L5_COCNU|nr:hypothetical protein COCNU_03G001320 [Cocos nucifera]
MKRAAPWEQSHPVSSDDSSDSDSDDDKMAGSKHSSRNGGSQSSKDIKPEERVKYGCLSNDLEVPLIWLPSIPTKSQCALIRKAEMYQEYMKQIPIPAHRGSVIPFTSWQGLAKSVKQLYGQPLHYLTNILLKQWDLSRVGTADSRKKKLGGMSYEALSRHGYHGGPSVLKVPPPRVEEQEPDWSWSTGKRSDADKDVESYEERERTRAAIVQGEKLLDVQTSLQAGNKEKKNLSFSQKEKRKRDLGQASRGKNYVEEEKRLLRESGIYSGFDS